MLGRDESRAKRGSHLFLVTHLQTSLKFTVTSLCMKERASTVCGSLSAFLLDSCASNPKMNLINDRSTLAGSMGGIIDWTDALLFLGLLGPVAPLVVGRPISPPYILHVIFGLVKLEILRVSHI